MRGGPSLSFFHRTLTKLLLASGLIWFGFDVHLAQQPVAEGPHQDSEVSGIRFSVPRNFKLEASSNAKIAFMRNHEISLFVAVPEQQADDKYLIELSNGVSRMLLDQEGFVWKIRPAGAPSMSDYQVARGNTKGLNAKTYIQTDYVVLKVRDRLLVVGAVGTYEGLKSAYNFEVDGAAYSFAAWRGIFHLISSITGETKD